MTTPSLIGTTRNLKLDFNLVVPTVGRLGPQWEVHTTVPWSKYPAKFWVPDVSSGTTPPALGEQDCVLTCKSLVPGKVGDREFHYRWEIVSYSRTSTGAPAPIVAAPVPPTSTTIVPVPVAPVLPEETMRPDHPSKRQSIERQCAMKAAVDLCVAGKIELGEIADWTEWFWDLVNTPGTEPKLGIEEEPEPKPEEEEPPPWEGEDVNN